jgi:replication-associated recombination protein RarA
MTNKKDWECVCGFSNFANRNTCRKCQADKPDTTVNTPSNSHHSTRSHTRQNYTPNNNTQHAQHNRSDFKRRLFDKLLKDEEAYKTMSKDQAKFFFQAMNEWEDLPVLLERLSNKEDKGKESIRQAIRINVDQIGFVNNEYMMFLSQLRTISTGIMKKPLLDLLRFIFNIPFLMETLSDYIEKEELRDIEPIIWFVLQLITEGDVEDVKQIRNTDKMKQFIAVLNSNYESKTMEMINNIMTGVASKKQKKEEKAGDRHNNDFINFRDIQIVPTREEVLCEDDSYLPLLRDMDMTDSTAETCVLDRQFRLMREDFVAPLREEIQELKKQSKQKRTLRRTFEQVVCESIKLNQRKGAYFVFTFVPPKHAVVDKEEDINKTKQPSGKDDSKKTEPTSKKAKEFWEKTSLLKLDSLVCFIRDGKPIRFGVVCDRDDVTKAKVGIMIIEDSYKSCAEEIGLPQPSTQMIQVTASLFSFKPVLLALQKIYTIPLNEELLFFEKQMTTKNPKHYHGTYRRLVDFINDYPNQDISSLLKVKDKFPTLILDNSQRIAMVTALKSRVALVQGPPGTGKSFIGALAAKVVHDCTSETILCVCYTNHALDQFLEDLIDIGVPAENIVRLGSAFKVSQKLEPLLLQKIQKPSFDRSTSKQFGSLKRDMENRENDPKLSKLMASISTREVLSFLDIVYPEYFDELQPTKTQGGFKAVGRGGKVVTSDSLLKSWLHGDKYKTTIFWNLPRDDRAKMYANWEHEIRETTVEDVASSMSVYNSCYRDIQRLRALSDAEALKTKRIIGCTTTAAAKYQQLLTETEIGVVIVEEAGEILESHVLTSLTSRVQHLIMIGDHQQLRPKVNVHNLTVESGRGLNLNMSLFERLVVSNYPFSVLSTQHRMHGSISTLVRELTYPQLQDDASVRTRSPVRGLQDTVVFIDHRELESDSKGIVQAGEEDGLSKANNHEVNMVMETIKYLLAQGYKTEDMVVLTPYLSQLRAISKALATIMVDAQLSEQDEHDLAVVGAELKNNNKNKKSVRVATIDNYQGEEANIVIASLVRSNKQRSIGFLKQKERVNVLLSRARNGMILIGNLDTLCNASSSEGRQLWNKVHELLVRDKHLYTGLPTVCQNHPTNTNILKVPQDFANLVSNGGCDLPCENMMKCGVHKCDKKCHPGTQLHENCQQQVAYYCNSGHLLHRKCSDKPRTICSTCEKLAKQELERKKREEKLRLAAEAKKAQDELEKKKAEDELAISEQALQDTQNDEEREADRTRLKIQKEMTDKKKLMIEKNKLRRLKNKERKMKENAEKELQKFNSEIDGQEQVNYMPLNEEPDDSSIDDLSDVIDSYVIVPPATNSLTQQAPCAPIVRKIPVPKNVPVQPVQQPINYTLLEEGFKMLDAENWMDGYFFFESLGTTESKYLTSLCQLELGDDVNVSKLPQPISDLAIFVNGLICYKKKLPIPQGTIQAYKQLDHTKIAASWSEIVNQIQSSNKQTTAPRVAHNTVQDEWEYEKNVQYAKSPSMDQLMAMIGLESVKKEFLDIYRNIQVNKKRGTDFSKQRFHLRLEGNPGTGKTTVARLYGQFLVELGVINGKVFEETSGSKLNDGGVADLKKLLGQILQGGGGLLFVDEAYQLEPKNNMQGKAVLNYLLTEMENNIGKLVVAFAGYYKDMDQLMAFNEGLPSRFPFKFKFDDYTDKELLAILQSLIKGAKVSQAFKVQDGLNGLYMQIASRRLGEARGYPGFGNARTVQNFWDIVQRRQTSRISSSQRQGFIPDPFAITKEDLIGPKPAEALASSDAWKKLQKMIGLTNVKSNIKALVDMVELNYELELQLKPKQTVSLNRVFLGNPGTGKTTVAKLYGQILNDIRLLSKNEVHLKAASDFIGSVLGQSETNTNAILKQSEGGVLVIDEAYGLFSGGNGGDMYKEAVINTLVEKVQNVPGEDRCVIMLGYKEQMEEMMRDSNPGLARRFNIDEAFVFEDYDKNDLMKILNLQLSEKGLTATFPAKAEAIKELENQKRRPNFGNGGAVANLISKAVLNFQKRVKTLTMSEKVNASILPEDFVPNKELPTLDEIFSDIIGCDKILAKLKEFQASIQFEQGRGNSGSRLSNIETNFIFVGPPGTGKTTVARRVGLMFESLGILSYPDVVEKSATDLQAPYVGQTGKATRKIFEEALGKVLFIDEAYRLNPRTGGQFMQEALDEIVQILTEDKFAGKMVVILAGYENEMKELMGANAGLSRRFSQKFTFENFSLEDSWKVLQMKLEKRGFCLGQNYQQLSHQLTKLINIENWGNGGDLETLAKRLQTYASTRMQPTRGNIDIDCNTLSIVMTSFLHEKQGSSSRVSTTSVQPSVSYQTQSHNAPIIRTRTAAPVIAQNDDDSDDSGDDNDNISTSNRDPNVSDEIWRELEKAKEEYYKRELERQEIERKAREAEAARIKAEKEAEEMRKRLQLIKEEKQRREAEAAIQRQMEEISRKVEEENRAREEQRRIMEERRREALEQERLKRSGRCPVGYAWYQVSGGWRCEGGSHFTSTI